MPPRHPASLTVQELLTQCRVDHLRAGGPGGQHRNKVATAIDLTHLESGIRAAAGERRSQAQNLSEAAFRLRVNLALAVRCSYEPGAPPGDLWRSRLRAGRIVLNPTHDDFPSMLAEALDVLAAMQFDMARAAAVLMCSASQLVKLLKEEPRALKLVNEQRGLRGLRAMK